MVTVPPPPWPGRPPEPERTSDGQEIHQGRYGPYIRLPNGNCVMHETDEELTQKLFRKRPQEFTTGDWDVW